MCDAKGKETNPRLITLHWGYYSSKRYNLIAAEYTIAWYNVCMDYLTVLGQPQSALWSLHPTISMIWQYSSICGNYFWIFICITYYCISWNFQVRASYYCRITSSISSTPATHSKVPQAWCIARWSSSMILIGIYFLFKIVDKFVGLKNVWRCSSAMKLNNKYACILTSESILFVSKKLMIHTLCGKSLVYV